MSAPEVVDEARRWLRYATEGSDAVEHLAGGEPPRQNISLREPGVCAAGIETCFRTTTHSGK